MSAFPYDLMYLYQELGGVGLSKYSDTVSIGKLAELIRTHRRGDEVAAAAKGVLERVFSAQDLYLQTRKRQGKHPTSQTQSALAQEHTGMGAEARAIPMARRDRK